MADAAVSPPASYPPPPRSLDALAWATVALLGATMVADLLGLMNDLRLPSLFGRLEEEGLTDDLEGALTRWDRLNSAAAWLQLGALFVTGVVFICWLWRARTNADSYGWTRQRRDRTWAVFGWVVPVVSLWFPFQVVSDVWKASHPARRPDQQFLDVFRVTPLLGVWWAAFLVTGLLGRVSSLGSSATDVDSLLSAVRLDELASVVDVGAAVLAVLVVLQITRFQGIRAAAPVPWSVPLEQVPRRPPLGLAAAHAPGSRSRQTPRGPAALG